MTARRSRSTSTRRVTPGPGARRDLRRRAARPGEPPRRRPGAAQGDALARRRRPGTDRPPRRAPTRRRCRRWPTRGPGRWTSSGSSRAPPTPTRARSPPSSVCGCATSTRTTAATAPRRARPCSSWPRRAQDPHRRRRHRRIDPMSTLLLFPGAGAGRDQSTLVALDRALRPDWSTVRADFDYRREGRRAPTAHRSCSPLFAASSTPSTTTGS